MNKDFLDHLNFPSHIPKNSREMKRGFFPRRSWLSNLKMTRTHQMEEPRVGPRISSTAHKPIWDKERKHKKEEGENPERITPVICRGLLTNLFQQCSLKCTSKPHSHSGHLATHHTPPNASSFFSFFVILYILNMNFKTVFLKK